MYLMYVDESGDPGTRNSPTRYFVLTGLVIHELRWKETLEELVNFRKSIRDQFGIKLRDEIHAAKLITSPGNLATIKRNDRLAILRKYADLLSEIPDLNIINVVIDKNGRTNDVFEAAWKYLIQRFENTISRRNFPGPANADERGMIFPDSTDVNKLRKLIRKMRQYNPIPNGPSNMRLSKIIEDPNFRDSRETYFIQSADVASYLLYQHLAPNAYMKSKSGHNYFFRLDSVLCKHASNTDPHGIVRG
jgi:hypothetical protein